MQDVVYVGVVLGGIVFAAEDVPRESIHRIREVVLQSRLWTFADEKVTLVVYPGAIRILRILERSIDPTLIGVPVISVLVLQYILDIAGASSPFDKIETGILADSGIKVLISPEEDAEHT